jgi:predicted  nucleic acid-binding Zn-ribbon protein
LENEIRQFQGLKSKIDEEFFGLKEKTSDAARETMYLKDFNQQLQQNLQKTQQETQEKKQHIQHLVSPIDQNIVDISKRWTNYTRKSRLTNKP